MMNDDSNFGKFPNGEAWKESTVYNKDNGIETKKNIRRNRKVVNGVV